MRASLLDNFESRDTIWKFLVGCALDAVREFSWPVRRILGFTHAPFIPILRSSRENFRLLKVGQRRRFERVELPQLESPNPIMLFPAWRGNVQTPIEARARHQIAALSEFDRQISYWASCYFDEQIGHTRALVLQYARWPDLDLRDAELLVSDCTDQREHLIQTFAQLERAALGIRENSSISRFGLLSACVILSNEAISLVIRTVKSENQQLRLSHEDFSSILRDCAQTDRNKLDLFSSPGAIDLMDLRKILQLIKENS